MTDDRFAELGVIRQAVSEMDDEWSEHRAMGQDRIEWGTWRALIAWLTNVADRMAYDSSPTPEKSHAFHISRTYLGHVDPRTAPTPKPTPSRSSGEPIDLLAALQRSIDAAKEADRG